MSEHEADTMTTTSKTIRLSAVLRQIAGGASITVELAPGATVRDLFDALQTSAPDLNARVLTDDGELAPGIQLIVDGRHIDFLQGFDTPLDDADDLFLIPPTYGG